MTRRAVLLFTLAVLAWQAPGSAHESQLNERLPIIGPAPPFVLTSQDGKTVTLADFRGKVVAVTFIYTQCPDICPLLTQKMARIQNELGTKFGSQIAFVSITVDPEHDTPEVLKKYARAFGAKLKGWSFLTGPPTAIQAITRRYGVYAGKPKDNSVDHTELTSLIDGRGRMRVQYMGSRFDPEEFRHDLLRLLDPQ